MGVGFVLYCHGEDSSVDLTRLDHLEPDLTLISMYRCPLNVTITTADKAVETVLPCLDPPGPLRENFYNSIPFALTAMIL